MILEEISCQEYQNFLDQQSHVDFLQSVEQGKRMAKQGWTVEYVQAKENGEIRAAAMLCMIPLMKIFRYCYIPRGYFCDYHDQKQIAEFTSLLKKHLSRRKVVYMEIDPVIILKERDKNGDIVEGGIDNSDVIEILKNNGYHHLPVKPGYDLARQCRYVSVLDLHPSADQLFKDLSYQTRQDIRTSEKYCVKVDSLDRNGLKMLDDMEKKTSEVKTTLSSIFEERAAKSSSLTEIEISDNFRKSISKVVVCEGKNNGKAAIVYTKDGKSAFFSITFALQKQVSVGDRIKLRSLKAYETENGFIVLEGEAIE